MLGQRRYGCCVTVLTSPVAWSRSWPSPRWRGSRPGWSGPGCRSPSAEGPVLGGHGAAAACAPRGGGAGRPPAPAAPGGRCGGAHAPVRPARGVGRGCGPDGGTGRRTPRVTGVTSGPPPRYATLGGPLGPRPARPSSPAWPRTRACRPGHSGHGNGHEIVFVHTAVVRTTRPPDKEAPRWHPCVASRSTRTATSPTRTSSPTRPCRTATTARPATRRRCASPYDADEIPATWDCPKCGRTAHADDDDRAGHPPQRVGACALTSPRTSATGKTHWDMLLERRTPRRARGAARGAARRCCVGAASSTPSDCRTAARVAA